MNSKGLSKFSLLKSLMIGEMLTDVFLGIYKPPALIFSTAILARRPAAGPPILRTSLKVT